MLEFPKIDKYAGIKSPIHSWDQRAKTVSILLLITSIVLAQDIRLAVFGLFCAILLVYVSNIPLSFIGRYMHSIIPFILFFFIILLFTVPGKAIHSIYFLNISIEGIYLASLISMRMFASILLMFLLLGTARFDHTLKAFEKLGVPNKFVQILMFSYRYIFVLIEEFQRISRSMDVRGFRKKTNMYSMKTLGKAVGILFVKSYERSINTYHAMTSRGYDGTIRTLSEFKMNNIDWVKSFMVAGLAVMLQGIGFVYV